MSLTKVFHVVRRRLWLQSVKRHYIALALELVSLLVLSWLLVPLDAPEVAPQKLSAQPDPVFHDAFHINEEYAYPSVVVYAPKNPRTDQLILKAFNGSVKSVQRMALAKRSEVASQCRLQWADKGSSGNVICVAFSDLFGAADGDNLEYELLHRTRQVVPDQLPITGPKGFKLEGTTGSLKDQFGFLLTEQEIIDMQYLSDKISIKDISVSLRGMPDAPPVMDQEQFRTYFALITRVIFCIPLLRRIAAITAELTTGMKDQQRINGLPVPAFWLGHFLSAFAIQMVDSAIIVCIMFFKRFYRHVGASLASLVLFVMIVFNTGHVLLAMVIATVCKKGSRAVSGGLFFGFCIPMFGMSDSEASLSGLLFTARWKKLVRAISPQLGLTTLLRTLAIFDDYKGGAGWGIIFKRALDLDSVTVFEMLVVMIVTCLVELFLLFYFSNVLPWATDYPMSPLFCLMPGYWLPANVVAVTEVIQEENRDPERFEVAPDIAALVDIRGVSMKFGLFTALDNVSFKIYSDQVTALLGHNGAGKTTLMSCITGLLKPSCGTIKFGGGESAGAAKDTGFCQQFDVFFPDMTVLEHLVYFGQMQGRWGDELRKDIGEILKAVVLTDKMYSFPAQLSGGMKRRLSLSIALVAKPKLLILDEPTTGMDPETRRSVWDLLSMLRKDTTILLSTHDMEEAEVLADRIVMLSSGKLVCDGTPAFLKKSCGVGYTICLNTEPAKFDLEKTLGIVRETVPNAIAQDSKQGSTTITLQTTEHKGFAKMFDQLEKNAERLGIASFGVTIATMADAYVKIATDWVPNEGGDDQHENTAPVESAPQAPLIVHTNNAGSLQRLRALLSKRLLYWYRSPMTIVLGWILPVVLFVLAAKTVFQNQTRLIPKRSGAKANAPDMLELRSNVHFGSARGFVEEAPATNFSKYFEALARSEGATIEKIKNAKRDLVQMARKDFLDYYRHYAYGITYNANTIEGWYNPASPVSANVLWNLITTALLRAQLRSPKARVTTSASFYSTDDPEQGSKDVSKAIAAAVLFWNFAPQAILGLTVSTMVIFPVLEKRSGALELQLMTGISGSLYTAAHFVFDFLVQYLPPFGVAFTVYLFGFEKELHFTGVAPVTTLLFALSAHYTSSLRMSRMLCVLVSPPFALGQAATKAITRGKIAHICAQARALDVHRAVGTHGFEAHYWPFVEAVTAEKTHPCGVSFFSLSGNSPLVEILIMACEGLLIFVLLSFLHSGHYADMRSIFCPERRFAQGSSEEITDEDVKAEKELAERLAANGASAEWEQQGCILVAHDLRKSYGSFQAVKGISLALRRGECFGLLGVNGAGKSTTFQMLAGLLELSSGEAYMSDVKLSVSRRRWQSFIGYCPQTNGLLEKLNAFEQLRLFARLRGIPEPQIEAAVQAVITLVDVEKHASKWCGTYSGGNKRKLSIAVAILGNPRVVFLDEPFAGIDVVSRTKITGRLAALRTEGNRAMVFTSHGMEECETACDRMCIMVAGQMTCLGTLPHLRDKFGTGYTMQLVMARTEPPAKEVNPADQPMEGKTSKALDQDVANLFPGVRVLGDHDNVHAYHIKEKLPWSAVFEKVEELEESHAFSHVMVQDTNLEQIFIAFAQKKDAASRA
ncbi:phospholipid-transporting ATPase ABCA3-like isoform X2 [Dermacentor albipictus]|uniref:phospholipid-transporting ATPase ABCA3-like isoform X2 n=1 Tax=Dermacentor albipictus TaxID=60249 RepID=UPI0031FE22BD